MCERVTGGNNVFLHNLGGAIFHNLDHHRRADAVVGLIDEQHVACVLPVAITVLTIMGWISEFLQCLTASAQCRDRMGGGAGSGAYSMQEAIERLHVLFKEEKAAE